MTKVSYSMGVTINTGNFESVRIDIGVEDDVRKDEDVLAATERVSKFVETRLEKKVDSLRKDLERLGR